MSSPAPPPGDSEFAAALRASSAVTLDRRDLRPLTWRRAPQRGFVRRFVLRSRSA